MTKVLVIDDEAPIRLLCRVNLEAEGMDVIRGSRRAVRSGQGAR
jgi:DNA-binding response OmpR family regulator